MDPVPLSLLRRRFLTWLLLAPAVAQSLALGGPAAAAPVAQRLTRRSRAGRVGEWFQFLDEATGLAAMLQLAAVRPGPRSPGLEQFALVFRGVLDCPPEGGLFRVTGIAGDDFALFVVPSGADEAGSLVRADCARTL